MTDTNHFLNGMEPDELPSDFIDSVMKIGGVDNIALQNLAWRKLQADRKEPVSAGTFCKQFLDEKYLSSAWRETNAIVHDALSRGPLGLGSDVLWVINKKDLSTQKVKAFTEGDKFLGKSGRNPYHKPCIFQFDAEIIEDSYSYMELASCIMPFRSPIPFVIRDSVFSLLGAKPWEAQLYWTIALQCWLVPADYGYLWVYTTGEGAEIFTRCEINKSGWYLPHPNALPVYVFSQNNKK